MLVITYTERTNLVNFYFFNVHEISHVLYMISRAFSATVQDAEATVHDVEIK